MVCIETDVCEEEIKFSLLLVGIKLGEKHPQLHRARRNFFLERNGCEVKQQILKPQR